MYYMILPKPLNEFKDTMDKYNLEHDVFEGIAPVRVWQVQSKRKNDTKFELYNALCFISMCYKGPFYIYLMKDKFYYRNFKIGQMGFMKLSRLPKLKEIDDLEVRGKSYTHLFIPKEERIFEGDIEALESSVGKIIDGAFFTNTSVLGFIFDKDLTTLSETQCKKLEDELK